MPDRRRTITLTVNDDFSRQLQQFVRQINDAESAVDNMQTSSGRGFMQTARDLRDLGLAAQTVIGTFKGFVSVAQDFSQVGTTARRNEAALRALTGSSAVYESQVQAIIRATRQTVTESEAAAFAYRLQRFGLAETSEEMESFIRTVSTVAAANPQLGDTAEAINQIQLTISNMSFMRLDQLGVSAGAVRKRMNELKEATADLTNEEAFQMALMEQLEDQANTLGDDFMEIGLAQEQAGAKARQLKEDLGKLVSEGLDKAIVAAYELWEILSTLGTGETIIRLVYEITGREGGAAAATAVDLMASPTAALEFMARMVGGGQKVEGQLIEPGSMELSRMLSNAVLQMQVEAGAMAFPPPMAASDFNFARAKQIQASVMDMFSMFRDVGIPPSKSEKVFGLPGREPQKYGALVPQREPVQPFERGDLLEMVKGMEEGITPLETSLDIFDRMGEGFINISRAGQGVVDTLEDIKAEAEGFDSLKEKFGIDPDSFDVDVLNAMKNALSEMGVEADKAALAVEEYEYQTGMSTSASLVFESQLERLAKAYEEGEITASQMAQQTQLFAQVDYSKIDRIISAMFGAGQAPQAQMLMAQLGGMDLNELQNWLDMQTEIVDVTEKFRTDTGPGFYEEMADVTELFVPSEEVTIFDQWKTRAEELTGWMESNVPLTVEASINEFVRLGDQGAAESEKVRKQWEADMEAVRKGIEAVFGNTTIVARFETYFNGQQIGGTGAEPGLGTQTVPEFQHGGYTGAGTGSFLARLHEDEYVIPGNLARGGGGGAQRPIVIDNVIEIDGIAVFRAIKQAARSENVDMGGTRLGVQ